MWLLGGIITLSKFWGTLPRRKRRPHAISRYRHSQGRALLGRDGKNTAWTDPVSGTVFHVEFAGASDDVLRLLSGIGVPTEPLSGFNLIHDC